MNLALGPALAPALAMGKSSTKKDWAIALVWALALALVKAYAAVLDLGMTRGLART